MLDIVRQRRQNQCLETGNASLPSDIVAWFGAMQAQDYAGVKWAVGLRSFDTTSAQVERVIADQVIVRTWLMRGTYHLVCLRDVRWMLDLISQSVIKKNQRRYKQLDLDEATIAHSNAILVDALSTHDLLTRRELLKVLEDRGVSTTGQRGVYLLQRASLDGLICQSVSLKHNNPSFFALGKYDDSQFQYEESPLKELATRYFRSHGPATANDFAWWSGLPKANVTTAIDLLKDNLEHRIVDDCEYYWITTESKLKEAYNVPNIHLLPAFDEYYLGYRDRDLIISTQFASQVSRNGVFYPMILIDGKIEGIWKQKTKKRTIEVSLFPFNSLTRSNYGAIQNVAKRYANYLDLKLNPFI